MAINAVDEETFILSDEVIDHIHSFFSAPNDQHEKTQQACAALQALINVSGMILCKMDCPNCWEEITKKAVESSFARMLKDVPAVRAEVEGEERHKSTH
jgi:hypothetical protein